MKIVREPFSDELLKEVLPLAQRSWEENTALKGERCAYFGRRDFQIEPDVECYRTLATAGVLVIITAREEGVLVGYAMGYLNRSAHHRSILCGYGDSIYLEPAYRGHGAALLRAIERELKEGGAIALGWPATQDSPLYALLKSFGYVGDDIVMEKLCA